MSSIKLDILAVGAHPDDVELGCSATLAKEVYFGKSVGILDLTQGELGTRGSAELRAKEAAKASEIIGVPLREQLFFADGFFTNDKQHQLEVIKVIRKYRPNIVLCNAPEDRHIDHPKASRLISEACFLSGLSKIDTGQAAWRPLQVYHYIQWHILKPDFVVDVTPFMDKKIEAVFAYSSQFYDPNSKDPETPITSKNFIDSVTYRARDLGRIIGVEYAEGFIAERYLAVNRITDLI